MGTARSAGMADLRPKFQGDLGGRLATMAGGLLGLLLSSLWPICTASIS